ncbi:MAG: hypothetical protein IKE43_07775 [Coriobacteriales bacterium]|nr:hypothetical protein [Coriobacteriales bacterium]
MAFRIPKLSFVCPFCFDQVRANEVVYRCINGWCPAYNEEDPVYAAYLGVPTVRSGHVFMDARRGLSSFINKSVTCKECGHPAIKVCPRCHSTLPDTTLTGDNNIISIIGTRSSGKSLYIGVLINELQKRIAPSLGASMQGFVDMSGLYNAQELYNKTKYDKLYKDGEILGQTMRHQRMRSGDDQDKTPLVYRFAYVNNKFGRLDDFTLAFFDGAGEDFEDASLTATAARYIAHSKGIIFLLDPLQIPEVLEQVEAHLGHKSTSTGTGDSGLASPDVVLSNITSLIKQSIGHSRIEIPVAISFSKFDAIQSIIPDGLVISQTSPHCKKGVLDDTDVQNINAEIRSLLATWNQQSLLTAIELDYKNYSFFTVSSLGLDNEPDSSGKIKKPRPHRVEDPLLWLMAENKLLMIEGQPNAPRR